MPRWRSRPFLLPPRTCWPQRQCAAELILPPRLTPSAGSIAASTLQVDRSVDDLIALFDRAKRSGYTGILLSDYKFQVLDRVIGQLLSQRRKGQVGRGRSRPRADPRGLLDRLQQRHLAHDPNLAEGVAGRRPAVRRQEPDRRGSAKRGRRQGKPGAAERQPAGGRARLEAGRSRFATASSKRPAATGSSTSRFRTTRAPARLPIARSCIGAASPAVSSRDRPPRGTPRPTCAWSSASPVRPHTAYRFSCWVKTNDLAPTGSFHLLALGHEPGRPIAHLPRRGAGANRRTGRESKSSSTAWTSAKPTSTPASGAKAKGPSGSTTWRSKSSHWSTS